MKLTGVGEFEGALEGDALGEDEGDWLWRGLDEQMMNDKMK